MSEESSYMTEGCGYMWRITDILRIDFRGHYILPASLAIVGVSIHIQVLDF